MVLSPFVSAFRCGRPLPGVPSRYRLVQGGLKDGLDLETDLDLVADHGAAAVHGQVSIDAEVLAIDLRGGGEPGPGAAIGVFREAVDVERQVHAPGHAVEREVALDHVSVAGWPDAQ